ncbi:MAG: ribosomal protein S18-alanine N-acetyltransferase [Ruminococcus sp.]|nr:ribosomal protein S18-alanine N-acetyltransferase [Ruminococcus sp.]MEE1171376.1 ribosomal protein S18-alanine N-acetyltransferase [Ruminococcus sp.]
MKLEKMTSAHIDGVCKIEEACFAHPWSRQSVESELANENSVFIVAVEGEKVIGYIGMSVVIDEGYIFNVAVDADFRRKGVGTALINELVTYGKKNNLCFITLEVRESNQAAISLYSDFGFIKVGERKNYYSDPAENAILMTKYF